MKQKYVVAIGTACIDEYYRADGWVSEGDKLLVRTIEPQVGGMIPNAASVFVGYGDKTYLLDSMNSGPVSKIITDNLRGYGLDLSYIIKDDSLADAKCIIVLTPKERTILVLDRGKTTRPLSERTKELLFGASYIYTTIAEFSKFEDSEGLADSLREKGVKLALDLESSTFNGYGDPLLKKADVLFFNDTGFEKYCTGKDPEVCVKELLDGGTEILVITLGKDGCLCRTIEQQIRVPGIRIDVKDTTGAGDTFNSSFVHCLMAGKDLSYAAHFSNAAAAYSVTRLGPKGGVNTEEFVETLMKQYYR